MMEKRREIKIQVKNNWGVFMDKKFIKTTDTETANKLVAYGYKLISHIGSVYTFLNEAPAGLKFEEFDKKKVVYDNKLML